MSRSGLRPKARARLGRQPDLAAAFDGNEDSLRMLLEAPDVLPFLEKHRMTAAVALRCMNLNLSGGLGQRLRGTLHKAAGWHLLLEAHLHRIGARLAAAEIPWLPFKGMDLCFRVYDQPAERPASDVDILVPASQVKDAVAALEADGWRNPNPTAGHDRFLWDEGYCWTLISEEKVPLEVHFRLWGLVPEAYAAAVLEDAEPSPALGATAHHPRLADAYVLAAVHAWMTAPPRPFVHWLDLELLHRRAGAVLVDDVAAITQRWDLQLPVALAALHTAALWPESGHSALLDALKPTLRLPERRLLSRARRRGTDAVTLAAITTARNLAGRQSRSRWRGARRRFWAHPEVVRRETPAHWPWPRRRLVHLLRRLGLRGLAATLSPPERPADGEG